MLLVFCGGMQSERLIHATASHGYLLTVDIAPEHEMEKVLYAVDELTDASARWR